MAHDDAVLLLLPLVYIQYTIYTIHQILYTKYDILNTIYYIHYTIYEALNVIYQVAMAHDDSSSRSWIMYYMPHATYTIYFILYTIYFTLYTLHYILHTYILKTKYDILSMYEALIIIY